MHLLFKHLMVSWVICALSFSLRCAAVNWFSLWYCITIEWRFWRKIKIFKFHLFSIVQATKVYKNSWWWWFCQAWDVGIFLQMQTAFSSRWMCYIIIRRNVKANKIPCVSTLAELKNTIFHRNFINIRLYCNHLRSWYTEKDWQAAC